MTLQETINAFASAFQVKQRATGEDFYSLKDGEPDWMLEAIRSAHGDYMPNDWHYSIAYDLAQEWQSTEPEDADTMRESAAICADNAVIYYHNVADWLALDFAARSERMDDVRREYGTDASTFTLAKMAMLDEIMEIAETLISAIEAEAEQ